MKDNFKSIFDEIRLENPPQGLRNEIMEKITGLEKRSAQIKFFSALSLIILSSLGLIWSFAFLSAEIYKTGIFSYLSIVVSDWSLAIAYWQDFVSIIFESLPVLGIAAFLSTVFVLLFSIRWAVNNAKNAFIQLSFNNLK